MKKINLFLLIFSSLLILNQCVAQKPNTDNKYKFQKGDYNGIGKWYMGREIAHVMGYQGIGWLERSERDKEENVSNLIQNMKIKPSDTIADVGAGSGYHVFRMAPLHHHFEQKGWSESTIVIRFWIISIILAIISLALLKLR